MVPMVLALAAAADAVSGEPVSVLCSIPGAVHTFLSIFLPPGHLYPRKWEIRSYLQAGMMPRQTDDLHHQTLLPAYPNPGRTGPSSSKHPWLVSFL